MKLSHGCNVIYVAVLLRPMQKQWTIGLQCTLNAQINEVTALRREEVGGGTREGEGEDE